MPGSPDSPDRRAFLLGAGVLLVAACTESSEDGGASETSTTAPPTIAASTSGTAASSADTDSVLPSETDELTPASFSAAGTCTLTATAATGPFPSAVLLDRLEIHEGYPGHPLRLGIRVTDAACQPLPGAVVDVWHTDASGDYSEFEDNGSGKDEGAGSSFCRGSQTANADGILEFLTIYPGWYDGRTVHIHATVWIEGSAALTTQLYLDEELTSSVHQTGEYAQFGPQDTAWGDDSLVGDPVADGTLLTTAPTTTSIGQGTLALVNIAVEM